MKSTKLHIPTPCSEDFTTMKSTETGAFCDKCAHEVIDFTNSSQEEISEIIKAKGGERICGRINSTSTKQKYSLNLLKIAASLAFLPMSDLVFSQEDTSAINLLEEKVVDFKYTLQGIVLDINGEPIPFTRVFIRGEYLIGGETDFNGNFHFDIPDSFWNNSDSLKVEFNNPEFKDQVRYVIRESENTTILNVTMPMSDEELFIIGLIIYDPMIDH